jgi:MFS family permease
MSKVSRNRTIFIAFSVAGGYTGWGLMLSLQPSFYPTEAEKKGATPSQYGFVFGILNLAALIFAPIFSQYGYAIGAKLLYNIGAFVQAIVALLFGFLIYCQSTELFLGLSYFLRFIDGVGEAATWGAVVSILMKLYPQHVTQVMSYTEMFFGLGYMLGNSQVSINLGLPSCTAEFLIPVNNKNG